MGRAIAPVAKRPANPLPEGISSGSNARVYNMWTGSIVFRRGRVCRVYRWKKISYKSRNVPDVENNDKKSAELSGLRVSDSVVLRVTICYSEKKSPINNDGPAQRVSRGGRFSRAYTSPVHVNSAF